MVDFEADDTTLSAVTFTLCGSVMVCAARRAAAVLGWCVRQYFIPSELPRAELSHRVWSVERGAWCVCVCVCV